MYQNFIYNQERGFVFAYVPKAACTNWKSILRKLAGATDWLDSAIAHDRERSGLTYLTPDPGAPNAGLPVGATVYTMVRNPYERALSAYLNKIDRHLGAGGAAGPEAGYWAGIVSEIDYYRRSQLGDERFPEIDFEVFLRWLKESESWSVRDEHWAPQSDLLAQPYVQFDYIGRFETIERDSALILHKMGSEERLPSQKDVKFAPTNARARLDAYLTSACRSLVEEIFAADFANFGYRLLSELEMKVRARQEKLKDSLIVNRGTGFVSVAHPFSNEAFVQQNFIKTNAASPKGYADFIAEKSLLPYLLQCIAEGNDEPLRVFDVGAFMGTFAAGVKHAADAAKIRTEVTCVEPNHMLLETLAANLSLHGVHASIIQGAVGPRSGVGQLTIPSNRMIGARVLNPDEARRDDQVCEPVDVVSLADVLPMEKTIGLIKLDIGGQELAAFRSILDSPSRIRNVFLIRLRAWQLDKPIDDHFTFFDWLNARFQIRRVPNPTLPKSAPPGEPLGSADEFGVSDGYVLAVPRDAEAIVASLWQSTTLV